MKRGDTHGSFLQIEFADDVWCLRGRVLRVGRKGAEADEVLALGKVEPVRERAQGSAIPVSVNSCKVRVFQLNECQGRLSPNTPLFRSL